MTLRSGHLWWLMLFMVTCGGAPVGCSMPGNPWRFAEPPTKWGETRSTDRDQQHPVVVVIGRFDDPSRAPNYSRGVGRAVSDAFSRSLMQQGGYYDVRINERLAEEARRWARFDTAADTMPAEADALTAEQRQARDRISRDREDVDYVILGKVTDFYHTSDLPDEASRLGLLGRRNEAIVSVDLRIVDTRSMKVVGTDHLMGTANAGQTRSHELYENIALDSYLFWNTPLGRAGRRAIDRAIPRAMAMTPRRGDESGAMLAERSASSTPERDASLAESPPTDEADRAAAPASMSRRFTNARPQILRTDDSRRVTIMGGRNIGVEPGDRFHILREVGVSSDDALVADAVTGRPVRIAILDVAETTATGWLLGQKPRQLDLRGMLLTPSEPEPSITAVSGADETNGRR